MDTRIDAITVRADDPSATCEWYSEFLDYEHLGTGLIGPRQRDNQSPDLAVVESADRQESGMAWGHLGIRVQDVETAYADLLDRGVDEYLSPTACGGSIALIRDLDGRTLELVGRDFGPQWGIDHVMLRVTDVNRAIGWYVRTLDFTLERRYDSYSNPVFDGPHSLYFLGPRGAPETATVVELAYNPTVKEYVMGQAWESIDLYVEDLETVRNRVDTAEKIVADKDGWWTDDPEGHRIRLVTAD